MPGKWSGPFRIYEVVCPHCKAKMDLREFDYVLIASDQKPTFVCETPEGKGCGRKFQVVRVEKTTLISLRAV